MSIYCALSLCFSNSRLDEKKSDEGDCNTSLPEVKAVIKLITPQFREHLEITGVALSSLQDKIDDAINCIRKYFCLKSTHYRKVWHNRHVCSTASSWPNLPLLYELVPFSNGRVEQIFSSLKIIKTTNRLYLSNSKHHARHVVYALISMMSCPPLFCNFLSVCIYI